MRACRRVAHWLRPLVLAGLLAHVSPSADAQTDARVKIDTLSLYVAEPGSTMDFSLHVTPAQIVPRNAYVRIRGLPAAAILSDSFVVSPGVWSVPIAALENLRITVPAGVSGRSELTISVLDVDGKLLAEARSALVVAQVNLRSAMAPEPKAVPKPEPPRIETPKNEAPKPLPKFAPVIEAPQAKDTQPAVPPAPAPPQASAVTTLPQPASVPPAPAPAAPPAAPPQPAAPPAPPPVTPEIRQRNARMIEQGDKALDQGTIAAARQFYLRAAEAGDGVACLKLAETYDPAELARLKAQGITGDVTEAVRWYKRAVALGAAGAAEKLARVAAR